NTTRLPSGDELAASTSKAPSVICACAPLAISSVKSWNLRRRRNPTPSLLYGRRHATSGALAADGSCATRIASRDSGSTASPEDTRKREPSGLQSAVLTPCANEPTCRASPPFAGMTWTCGDPERMETKASCEPSGDQ